MGLLGEPADIQRLQEMADDYQRKTGKVLKLGVHIPQWLKGVLEVELSLAIDVEFEDAPPPAPSPEVKAK